MGGPHVKTADSETGQGSSEDTKSADSLILNFPASRTVKNTFLLFKRCPCPWWCYRSPNELCQHRIFMLLLFCLEFLKLHPFYTGVLPTIHRAAAIVERTLSQESNAPDSGFGESSLPYPNSLPARWRRWIRDLGSPLAQTTMALVLVTQKDGSLPSVGLLHKAPEAFSTALQPLSEAAPPGASGGSVG